MPKKEILTFLEKLYLREHADESRKRKRIHVQYTYVYHFRRDWERIEKELLTFGFKRGVMSWEIPYD